MDEHMVVINCVTVSLRHCVTASRSNVSNRCRNCWRKIWQVLFEGQARYAGPLCSVFDMHISQIGSCAHNLIKIYRIHVAYLTNSSPHDFFNASSRRSVGFIVPNDRHIYFVDLWRGLSNRHKQCLNTVPYWTGGTCASKGDALGYYPIAVM